MTTTEALCLFLEKIPAEYPKHMLCYFAGNAARGTLLPFTVGLLKCLAELDSAMPGYAKEVLDRIAGIKGTGEPQYEAVLEILGEMYVTQGVVEAAHGANVSHEPGRAGGKNPECEALIADCWCAIEVKTPRLIAHRNSRATKEWQLNTRMPTEFQEGRQVTLPRDNPVKDFLISSEAKFEEYETYRQDALRILVIVWDDFCNEPIAALVSPVSGLLTPASFHRDSAGAPVRHPHVDGIIIARHQHQLLRATRCEPLIDGVLDAMRYRHDGFPMKAFIQVPGNREVPRSIIEALNAVPLGDCLGAEYQPAEMIIWVDAQ